MNTTLIGVAIFAVTIFGLCKSVDFYWMIKGMLKHGRKRS